MVQPDLSPKKLIRRAIQMTTNIVHIYVHYVVYIIHMELFKLLKIPFQPLWAFIFYFLLVVFSHL